MKVVAALGVLVLLLMVSPVISQAPDDKLIVPGQRIGKWTLEMTIDDLIRINGRPAVSAEIPADSYWINRRLALGWEPLFAASLDGKTVVTLWVAGEAARPYRTDKGISVGSTIAQVTGMYGRPSGSTRTTLSIGPIELIYDDPGMWFTIAFDQVFHVGVFRPQTARTIWRF